MRATSICPALAWRLSAHRGSAIAYSGRCCRRRCRELRIRLTHQPPSTTAPTRRFHEAMVFDAFGLGSYASRMLAKVPAMILGETHPAGLRAGDGAQDEDALVDDHFRTDRSSAPKQT